MKKGLVSISFRPSSAEEIIRAASAAGLSAIEWGSDVHAQPDDTETLQKIVRLCAEKNLQISSYGTYFRIGKTPAAELPAYIRTAKLLGTDILRLWCGTKGYADFSEAEKRELIAECRRLAATAEESGVVLCMECHPKTFTDNLDGALTLMREVHSPHFRMYWQPNQHKTAEENLQYAAAIAPYCPIVHVFNWAGKERFSLSEAVPLWKEYLKPFREDVFCLLEFMPDDRIESLPAEAAVLSKILEG